MSSKVAMEAALNILRTGAAEGSKIEPVAEGFFISVATASPAAAPPLDLNERVARYFVDADGRICEVPTFVQSAEHFEELLSEEGGEARFHWAPE